MKLTATRDFFTSTLMLCGILASAPSVMAQSGPTKVKVEEVIKRTFQDRTEALGTLRANESVELTVTVTDTITAIYFEDGQNVVKGDLLVEMTSEEEKALLEEASTNAVEAGRQLKRVSALVEAGTASESLLDERRRDYDAATARLSATQSRLSDRLIRAPFSGRVGLRNVSLGALVRPGDLITTVTDDSTMKLDFTVPTTFLPAIKRDLPITATTRAFGEKQFTGKVSSVSNVINPTTRAVTVRALMPNDSGDLRQGILMEVELFMKAREGLAVPEGALLPEGADNYVMVAVRQEDQWVAERRKVNIASRQLGEVEVVDGVKEGELVVTDGAFKLRSGAAITVPANDKTAALAHH